MERGFETCVVFLLGYPGVGKRTVGSALASLLDGVLIDNQLINIPLLTLFKWDGKAPLPEEIWDRVEPIRDAVLGTLEDLAPKSNSYVFTNPLHDDVKSALQYERVRSLAHRRGSLFLAVTLSCDADAHALRIDTPDRVSRLKGSDPENYIRYRRAMKQFRPPEAEVLRLDTTTVSPADNAFCIYEDLVKRGLVPRR